MLDTIAPAHAVTLDLKQRSRLIQALDHLDAESCLAENTFTATYRVASTLHILDEAMMYHDWETPELARDQMANVQNVIRLILADLERAVEADGNHGNGPGRVGRTIRDVLNLPE